MKHIGARLFVPLISLLVAASALAITSKPVTLQLKLPKKPPEPRPVMAGPLTKGPLSLSVIDVRGAEEDEDVGVARESGADIYVWRASQPVLPSVAGFVTHLLSGWSIPLAPEADFGLRFELARYFVTEKSETFGSTYAAEVRLKTSFVAKDGRVLWTGESSGEAKRPGVDGRASLCNEALSLALRNAVASALTSIKPDSEAAAAPAPKAPLGPSVVEPDALFTDLTRLRTGGVEDDVLVAYVEQRKLSRPLTVDEILQWKRAGIPDAAIRAATK
jgi:hypothetical protein